MSAINIIDREQFVSDSQRSTSTSGSNTINNSYTDIVYVHEAGVTATLTVNLPAIPINNQIVTIVSVAGITALTLATSIGSIVGSVSTLSGLGSVRYMWLGSQSKWYKV